MRKLSSRPTVGVAVAALLALGLLSGCASAEADSPPAASATADPDAVVSIEMPDLGPSPAPDELTEEQREALRLERQDDHWQSVAKQYPDAVRPVVDFAGYTADDDLQDDLNDCYVSKGLTLGLMIDEEGNESPGGVESDTREGAIDIFLCNSLITGAYQPPNDAQLGYIYDYLTEFLVPCYEANGIENPAPPTREEFIANWPNQNWFPMTGLFGEDRDYAVNKACPNTK